MHFALPILWREQKDHFRDCFSCLTNVKDFFAQSTHGIQYQNFHSTIWPVPHDVSAIPKPPVDCKFDKAGEESFSDNGHGAVTSTACLDPDFLPLMYTSQNLITQQELHNLVRGVNLSQTQSYWFHDYKERWNLLDKSNNSP